MRGLYRTAALIAAVLLAPSAAQAAGCTISTTSIDFGAYNVFSSGPTDSTATITYRCSGNAAVAISITRGRSDTFNPRIMAKGTEHLGYNLYLDSSQSTVWGETSSGTESYYDSRAPNNKSVTVTVFGRIPAGQDVSAGSYSDSVVAVVLF